MQCPKCGDQFPWHVQVCPTCDVDLLERLPGPEPTPEVKLVRVLVTGDAGLIPFAKSLLEDETIEYLVRGESVQDLFGAGRIGGFNYVVGPVEFWVRPEDADRARALLEGLSATTSEGIEPSEDDA